MYSNNTLKPVSKKTSAQGLADNSNEYENIPDLRNNGYLSFSISSFSTRAITAQSTVLASGVRPISSSINVAHHFFTRSSNPSRLLLVTLHPATYMYSISQQGRRTKVESEIPLQPRISSNFNLLDFFRILSICPSSIPSKYPR